jgi:REP element-mobilizing transposase RayT
MRYNPDLQHRRAIRLAGYDYSRPGAYYVTICTATRECLFGEVTDYEMRLNGLGCFVQRHWLSLPVHYANVKLDSFIVMPNHIHGIIRIADVATKGVPLSEIVRGFKTWTARRINERRGSTGTPLWQRDYYEHIIRDDADLRRIRQYIIENPANWKNDTENPANLPSDP